MRPKICRLLTWTGIIACIALLTFISPLAVMSAQPDLVVQSLAVNPTSVNPGGNVTVNFTVKNQGNGVAGSSTTNIRLNTSSTNVTKSDPLLKTVTTPALAAGASTTHTETVTISKETSAGNYYVWIILDVDSIVGQSNENNDRANTPLTVIDNQQTADSFRFPLDGGWDERDLDFGKLTLWKGEYKYHLGEDELRSSEVPVYAPANGMVKHNAQRTDYGYVVVIEHRLPDSTYVCSVHGHLRAAGRVAVGTQVSKGQIIGYLSSDKNENGNVETHLHFGIRSQGYSEDLDTDGQWRYRGYGPGDIADSWYRPTDFIKANGIPPKSTKFKAGDLVKVIWGELNLRKNYGLGGEITTTLTNGMVGQALDHSDNGSYRGGYWWWYVQFGDKKGWCAEAGLEKTTPTTYTLTVVSSNPNSGVNITVIPNDNNNQGNGTTPFKRTYDNDTVVILTAPATAGGNNFKEWQRNETSLSFDRTVTVTMNADYTITAVYSPGPVLNIVSPTPGQVLPAGTTSTTLIVNIANHTSPWHWKLNEPFPTSGSAGGNKVASGNTATITGLQNGRTYTVYAALADGNGNLLNPSVTVSITFSVASPSPAIPVSLQAPKEVPAGTPLTVEVVVGAEDKPATSLFGISFQIVYRPMDVVSITANDVQGGDLLGDDIIFFPQLEPGKISIGASRKPGSFSAKSVGTIAKMTFLTKADLASNTTFTVELTEPDVKREDGQSIVLDSLSIQILITSGIAVWPGDTNNDSRVNEKDIIPLGFYWNKKGTARVPPSSEWNGWSAHPWEPLAATYADANGDGVVNEKDVIPIGFNWGKTHSLEAIPPAAPREVIPKEMLLTHEPYYRKMLETLGNDFPEARNALIELLKLAHEYAIPERSALLSIYPNPSNPETWIPYKLAESSFVTIRIFDVVGHLVRTLEIGYREAGSYTTRQRAVYWDGKNDSGEKVASGVYLCQLRVGNQAFTRRVTVLK